MANKSMGFNVLLDADTKRAEQKVGAFAESMQRRIQRAVRSLPAIELRADSSAADRRIAEIQIELAALADKRIGIDIDAGAAHAQIERLRTELVQLGSRSPSVQVRADTAKAAAALAAVSGQAQRLDGQNVNIAVNASDVARTISLLGLLTAGLAGVGAMVAPAAAALAALPALAGAAVQGVGALAAGFSGVGGAVKALQQEETKAAAGTAQSAASRVSSANAIVSAQRAVEDAVLAADRAAITGAQQVADAREAVADAYEAAAESVESAEQDLADAQVDARLAQEDLTRARAEAREELEDLSLSLRDAHLDERDATIKLAEAQEDLAAARQKGVTGRDLEKAELKADKAALALDKARERQTDLAAESQRASQVGVEGSDRVVAAQRRADDAARSVTDAEGALADAREQGAEDVTRAQQQLARATQQASWAQQDAARRVADAQRNLANAYTDTGNAGASSANKVKEVMADLSPEAQRFARFLVGEVIPGLKQIRAEVQASLLPDMETTLRNLSVLGPDVADGLSGTADVIGDLSVKGSEMMTAGPWRADFRDIMAGNNRVLGDFGEVGLDVLDVLRNLGVTSLPMVERWSQWTERVAEQTRQFIESKRATGELDEFFDRMGDTLAEVGSIVADIVVGTYHLTTTMAPLGMVLLRTVADLVGFIGEIARANPEIARLAATLLVGAAAFNSIGKAVAGAALAREVATGGWRTLIGVVGGLGPASVAQSAAMLAAGRTMDAAALSAGTLTERLTGSAAAGERVANSGGKVSSTLTKVGSAIPVLGAVVIGLGLAYDGLVTSADEAADALLKGGAAAEQASQNMRTQGDSLKSWLLYVPVVGGYADVLVDRLVPGLKDAQAAADGQRAAMDPLARATSDAARAQNDYLLAVERQDWVGAADAQRRYGEATAEVKRQQELLKGGLDATTRSLEDQQNSVLGAIEADIRWRDALDRVRQGFTENGLSLDLNTEAGRRNQANIVDLIRAHNDEIDTMRRNGATVDELRFKEEQHRQQLDVVRGTLGANTGEIDRMIGAMRGVPPRIDTNFLVHTEHARAEVGRFAHDVGNIMASVRDEQVIVSFASDTGNILHTRAMGGPINGRGTETSDSIPALLSNNEHVWSASEVRGAGGHGSVQRLRTMAASGRLPGFAQGGAVSEQFAADYIATGLAQVKAANAKFIKDNFPVGGNALSFARSQAGKPYIWAAVGPSGYDCSGFMSAITNVLRGKNPHSRVGATANFPWSGFRPGGGGTFVIGSTANAGGGIGHMAGTLHGVNVESRGSDGVVVGPRARGANDRLFNTRASYAFDRGGIWRPGTLGMNLSGRPERVLSPSQTAAFERLVNVLTTRVGNAPPVMYPSEPPGARGGMDWPALVPVMRAALAGALESAFASGFRADVDYEALTLRLNRVAAINRRR